MKTRRATLISNPSTSLVLQTKQLCHYDEHVSTPIPYLYLWLKLQHCVVQLETNKTVLSVNATPVTTALNADWSKFLLRF